MDLAGGRGGSAETTLGAESDRKGLDTQAYGPHGPRIDESPFDGETGHVQGCGSGGKWTR